MVGRILGGRYELGEKIGSGGMAEVYRGHDTSLDRPVAIKILHEAYRSDIEFIEKFHSEAKAAGRLLHPNIVNIYDVGIDGVDHYIVMEYAQGNSLKDKIREEGALDILTVTKIAKDIASGLAHAHAHNLVHCDIKPHNILMTPDGHAKIADFGIARAVTESTMTYGGNVVGSVHYFSPEQAQGGTITPKSDVYSLGIVMYEMLTNRLPFNGENPVAVAMKHIEEEPPPPSQFRSEIPPMLEAVVIRAMNKNPELRPSSFDMIQVLSNVEANLSVAQMNDPDATKILPRPKTDSLPPRRNILNQTQQAETSVPAKKTFLKSKLFIVAIILFLTVGFGAGILMSFGTPWDTEEIPVPDVVGKQRNLARQILEDTGLRVTVSEIYDSKVPAGEVVKQEPPTGRNVKAGRFITIYVSKGGETIEVPDLVGLTKSAATERIQKLGLQLGSVYEKDSEREPGTVLSHDPAIGTKIHRGQFIDLVVSRGAPVTIITKTETPQVEEVLIPDVQNYNLDIAKNILADNGFTVGNITYEESTQGAGTILSQYPAPNTQAEIGANVDLIVAKPIPQKEEHPGEYGIPENYESNEPSYEDDGDKIQ